MKPLVFRPTTFETILDLRKQWNEQASAVSPDLMEISKENLDKLNRLVLKKIEDRNGKLYWNDLEIKIID